VLGFSATAMRTPQPSSTASFSRADAGVLGFSATALFSISVKSFPFLENSPKTMMPFPQNWPQLDNKHSRWHVRGVRC
jgi:hypothetical protein